MATELELDIVSRNEFLEMLKATVPELEKLKKVASEFGQAEKDMGATILKNMTDIEKSSAREMQAKMKQHEQLKTMSQVVEKMNAGPNNAAKAAEKAVTALKGSEKELQKLYVDMTKLDQKGKELIQNVVAAAGSGDTAAVGALMKEFEDGLDPEQAQVFASGVEEGMVKAEKAISRPVQELRELKRQIVSGELKGEALVVAEARAAALADEIGDVNSKIKAMSSDTQGIDTLVAGMETIAGAAAIAQGASALFGEENEDLQKTLVKVTSTMAILNGIQAVSKNLQKDSALVTGLNAGAQKAYALAVGTSTGALKGFRAALLATGLGAVIVGIATLAANFDEIKEVLNIGTNPATKDYAEETRKAGEASRAAADAFEVEERKMRALGATAREIAGERKKTNERALADLEEEINAQRLMVLEAADSGDKEEIEAENQKLLDLYDLQKEYEVRLLEAKKEGVDHANKLADEAEAELAKKREESNDKAKADGEKFREEQKQLKEKLFADVEQLLDDAERSEIEHLTGEAKIAAELAYQQAHLDVMEEGLKAELDKIKFTGEERAAQEKNIADSIGILRADAERKAAEERLQINLEAAAQEKAQLEAMQSADLQFFAEDQQIKAAQFEQELLAQRDNFSKEEEFEKFRAEQLQAFKIKQLQDELTLLVQDGDVKSKLRVEQLKLEIENLKEEAEAAKPETSASDGFLMSLFGVDAEGLDELKGALAQATNEFANFFGEIVAQQIAASEQKIDAIDEELSTQEEAIKKEQDAKDAGRANNLRGEQQRLAELKKQREAAVKEQEKLRKREVLLDSVSQGSSLITAAAKTFSSLAGAGPAGIILAIAQIASMLAFMAKLRGQLKSVQLRKGGVGDTTGVVTGRTHEQGGERFTDHIEVERGEVFGVLSQAATRRHQKEFFDTVMAMNEGTYKPPRMPAFMNIVNSPEFEDMKRGSSHDIGVLKQELRELNSSVKRMEKELASRPKTWQEGNTTVVKEGTRIKKVTVKP